MIYNITIVPDPDNLERFVLEHKGDRTPNLTMDELLRFIRSDVEMMDTRWQTLRTRLSD